MSMKATQSPLRLNEMLDCARRAEQLVKKLEAEKQSLARMSLNQQKILEMCPGGMPDGTGIFTPESWIRWARKKLGYDK